MLPDYDNDKAMAELGRSTAKRNAINKARETIRDCATKIVSFGRGPELIEQDRQALNKATDELIAVLSMQ